MFYSLLTAAALAWTVIAGRPHLVYDPGRATWLGVGFGALAGLLLGLGVVLLSRISVARLAWAREFYRWVASRLGPLTPRDVLALALLSSVGEELFFRGAMQPTLGLWPTSIIFALMHLPKLSMWPWTISALVMGLWFGLLSEYSGNLAGAVVAHFVINYLNLGQMATFAVASPAQADLPPRPPPEND